MSDEMALNTAASAQSSNYLAKDYESFRQVILDHLALTIPDWTERQAADLGIALIELFAYSGDYLSYHQDAVGAEAYLHTARQRISVRRHARLLDYRMGEGCNARVWVQLETSATSAHVRQGAILLPLREGWDTVVDLDEIEDVDGPVFETMHPIEVRREQNQMFVYDEGELEFQLKPGALTTRLLGHYPHLEAGDVLVFESSETANPAAHAVRLAAKPELTGERGEKFTELRWMDADALPWAFPVSTRTASGRLLSRQCVVRGNIVLASHGRTGTMMLPVVSMDEPYTPKTGLFNVTHEEPYCDATARKQPATATLIQSPAQAEASVALWDYDVAQPVALEGAQRYRWTARRDLLASNRFSRDFIVEIDNQGEAVLRFGNGQLGRPPAVGHAYIAQYRIGQGAAGNIGRSTLAHIVAPGLPITLVRNPMAAVGGLEPETMDQVRIAAPRAFRQQRRCVTPGDYASVATQYAGVASVWAERSAVNYRYVKLYVKRHNDQLLDGNFAEGLAHYLEPFKLIGDEVTIHPAERVEIEPRVNLNLDKGWAASRVHNEVRIVLEAFSNRLDLGQPVYPSQLVALIAAIPGVANVELTLEPYSPPPIPKDEQTPLQPILIAMPTPSMQPLAHQYLRLTNLNFDSPSSQGSTGASQ